MSQVQLQTMSEQLSKTIAKYEQCKSIQDIFLAQSSSFGTLARRDEIKTKAMLKIMFIRFSNFVNVKNPLTEEHIDFLADTIVGNYKWLTIADLCFILKQAKMGKYGNLYERLSPMQIFHWIDEHFENRCNIAEQQSIAESKRYKEE